MTELLTVENAIALLTLTGSYVESATAPLYVNNVEVENVSGTTATGTWTVSLPTDGSSGSK